MRKKKNEAGDRKRERQRERKSDSRKREREKTREERGKKHTNEPLFRATTVNFVTGLAISNR